MPFLRPEPSKAAGLFYAPGFLSAGPGWRIHRPSAFWRQRGAEGVGISTAIGWTGVFNRRDTMGTKKRGGKKY